MWRCDDYDDWIAVGMTLAGLGDAGLGLWDEWSKQSQKYEADCCKKAWKYLKPDGLTLKTLVKWAQDDAPASAVASVGKEPIDVRALKLPGDVLNAIAGYAPTWGAQRPCTDRSKADWIVVKNLIERGATDGQIATVFKEHPIGQKGKYAERGDSYLAATIQRARRQFQKRIQLC